MKICPKCGTEYPDTTTLCPADGNALERTGDSLVGKTLAGKYRIEEKISEGGMGGVYRGTHVLMDKTVAIKVLHPSLAADEKIVARFSREARAASRISHPHALSVTDFGEDEAGVVFLVMEYLSGRTLKEVVREDGPMPLKRAVEIIKQVGGALDAAHEQGVVHRDLKSDNVMLLTTNSGDYAKVLDFGIAKIKEPDDGYDAALTAPDLVIGTPQYMSPEQCSQSQDIDARSDIYSLGIILYEMLVGHLPFTGPSPTAIMMKQLQEAAPSVHDERPDLPEVMGMIIKRAMAKLPENRYQKVSEMVEDLTMAAEHSVPASEGGQHRVGETMAPADQSDEETLVRARGVVVPTGAPVAPAPTLVSSFNPWKVLIPSVVGLLIIFGVIYAFTRGPERSTLAPTEPSLVSDPNSQPVETVSPPTGRDESMIPVGNTTNSTVSNSNASPSPADDQNALDPNANFEPDANVNVNSNRTAPVLPLPSPPKSVNANTTPEPAPSSKPSPNPTLPSPTVPAPTP
ncbi:MAG TPA: protein kinase [Pyrinomonadaceae bacterium]|nr:protein kinase [Pyrinomonadaceae bacterium]